MTLSLFLIVVVLTPLLDEAYIPIESVNCDEKVYTGNDDIFDDDNVDNSLQKKFWEEYSAATHIFIRRLHG
jgi:hypothetical protein